MLVATAKNINEAQSEAIFRRVLNKRSRGGSAFDALMGAMMDEFGTVYFLRAGPFIKIGFTRWPIQRRIAQLSTGCPYDISVIAEIRGSPDIEAECHKAFAQHHVRGEWFHASTEILKFIASVSELQSEVAA
jgi:hypothetical protein